MFHTRDDAGLLVGNIPYYGIELTGEQVELIRNKKLEIYEINGKSTFEIRGLDKEPTGKFMMYILWK